MKLISRQKREQKKRLGRPDKPIPKRNIVLGVLSALLVVLLGTFVIQRIYNHFHGGTISVYSMTDLYLDSSYFEDDSEMEGQLYTTHLQTEYLSDSQTVAEVYVSKGDTVSKGDKLFAYDSTLDKLDLQRKSVSIQKKELQLEKAKKKLALYQTYRAGVPVKESGSSADDSVDSEDEAAANDASVAQLANDLSNRVQQKADVQLLSSQTDGIPTYAGLQLLGGGGTLSNPYCYEWKNGFKFTDTFIAAAMQGRNEAFVKFYVKEEDLNEEQITDQIVQTSEKIPQAAVTSLRNTTGAVVIQTGGDSDASANLDTQYAGYWVMQFQKTESGYLYTMISICVGGAEQKVSDPMPSISGDGTEEIENGGTIDGTLTEEEEQEQINGTIIGGDDGSIGGNDGTDGDDGGDDGNDGDDGADGDDETVVYTREQIAKMIADQEQKIKDIELKIRKAKISYEKKQRELEESVVYSKIDGTVTTLRSQKKAGTDKPFIKISGKDAGYLVVGTINEFDLSQIELGQTVKVTNGDTDETYDGTITKISQFSASKNDDYYGYMFQANPNASMYPFTVQVDEDADFDEDSYITMSLQSDDTPESVSFYLPNSFIRTEGGSSYIYIRGEDGKLEKRTVKTGGEQYGMYTEIVSGATLDDMIAFPYGQKVHDGAPTKEGSMDELYGYY